MKIIRLATWLSAALALSAAALAQRPARGLPLGDAGSVRASGRATLECSYLALGGAELFVTRIQGAGPSGFRLFLEPSGSGPPLHLGTAPTDADGAGELLLGGRFLDGLPANFELALFATYMDARGSSWRTDSVRFLLNAKPRELLDFDWAPGGVPLEAGTLVADQWASIGIRVSADNAHPGHPDAAILYDSSDPGGADPDLTTPGLGPRNDVPRGMLLVIAENLVDGDGDGRVDVPDDEAWGGTLVFDFARPVVLCEATLIDVDVQQEPRMRCFHGPTLVQDVLLSDLGDHADNNSIRLGFAADPITRLEIELDGSAGLAELWFVPCAEVVGFDTTLTGIPTGLRAGERLVQQFQGNLGFTVLGQNPRPSAEGAAILFDTAAPTGGDNDLATPGYHPTNDRPLGLALILAENTLDAGGDGLVDVPDDEAWGGVLSLEFEYRVVFRSVSVVDVDANESSYVELYRRHSDGDCALYDLVATLPLAALGDNSVQTVVADVPGVDRIDFVLGGSGAIADLSFCRDGSDSVR